jgi:signal transduction histidine kinase
VISPLATELRRVEVLAGLTDEQLEWLASHGQAMQFGPGEMLFREGDPADSMFFILEGSIDLLIGVGGQMVPTFVQYAGEVTGLLPFSRMMKYSGAGRASARGPLRILRVHKGDFGEMLARIPVLGQRLVATMTDRVREATRAIQQREKMTALGTLAAGLAHELNNPAAAVRRDAEALETRLSGLANLAADLCSAGLDGASLRGLGTLAESLRQRPAPTMDAIGRSRLEEALGEWLDEQGIAEAWTLAGALVDAGVTKADLETLGQQIPSGAVPSAVRWIETLVDATRLSLDIRAASARISELVQSVKTYSHMDRAGDKEAVDVREGLDSTLVMLGHKLKRKSLQLERDYASDLPKVTAYPGELNQVWTNLIDNAIDAAPEGGLIRIEAGADSVTSAAVRVIDNGPGVPLEIQSRIFEPFFTTKPVGQGTGLGLDIVERIVVQQHGGTVELESQPGRTIFTVRLPLTG